MPLTQRTQRSIHRRPLVSFALIFVLVFRAVVAPFVVAAPAPGYVAICTGSKIIYIPWDGGEPVEGEFHTDPCPAFGIAVSIEPPAANFERTDTAPTRRPRHFVAMPAVLIFNTAFYETRAPPFSA